MNKTLELTVGWGEVSEEQLQKVRCKTGSGQGPAAVCSCDLGISAEGTFLQRLHCVRAGATPSTQTIKREVGHSE